MRSVKLLLLLLCLCLFHAPEAQAAKMSCVDAWDDFKPGFDDNVLEKRFPSGRKPAPQSCRAIYIDGTLVPDDAEQFRKLLSENHPFVSTVLLNSFGGSVSASAVIGALVRQYHLITVAPSLPSNLNEGYGRITVFPGGFAVGGQHIATGLRPDTKSKTLCEGLSCFCASACVNIWVAGNIRFGNFLGVHQPYTTQTQNRDNLNLSPVEVKVTSEDALAFTQAFYKEMEAPPKMMEQLNSTVPQRVAWSSPRDIEEAKYPSSILQLLKDVCSSEIYILDCYIKKLDSLRDALPPP